MVKMKPEYDFGGIFGQGSKNHDKIPTTNLRSRKMHQSKRDLCFQFYWNQTHLTKRLT